MNTKNLSLSRRDLVRASAAAFAAPAFLAGQSPNETVRVGFIGVGGRGTTVLQRVVKSPGVRVVAVCDIDPEARQRAAGVIGDPRPEMYSEFRKLLDRKDIDAVFIATPVDLHKEMAVAALEVHKHVYLEKPVAHRSEDVHAVARAAESSRGQLQLGFQLRYDPARRTAIEHIHQGGIGRIAYLQGNRHTSDLPRAKEWLFDASRSGNNIVEQACHILDLMNWAMKGHPISAYGLGGINVYQDQPPGRTTWDHYAVVFEFPGNIVFNFTHLFIDPRGFTGISEKIWGTEWAIDLASATKHRLEPESRQPAPSETLEFEPGQDATQLAVDAFFGFARDNKEPLNNITYGRYATLTAIMGRMAIEQRRVVKWEEVDA